MFLHINDIAGNQKLAVGTTVTFFIYSDRSGLGAERASLAEADPDNAMDAQVQNVKAPLKRLPAPKASAAPKAAATPSVGKKASPNLPRQRITDVPTTGEVLRWNKGYGWIRAHEPIHHPQAKPDGSIFVGQGDLQGITKLEPGMLVQFHLFTDSSGLGAEECSAF